MKIYYYVEDMGDGSTDVRWTDEAGSEVVRQKADRGDDYFWFAGESLTELEVPEDFVTINKIYLSHPTLDDDDEYL
jgi:hypothetical protein